MAKRQNQPIATWQDGDVVSGFALVGRKESRRDRNNKSFLDLELLDASGSIPGKVWSDSSALESDFEAHDFVAVRGTVKDYKGQLQVSVLDCRRATDSDREHGFDEALLVPSTREDIGEMSRRLESLLEARISEPVLRRLARETLAVHGRALKEHPAAKGIHHAYRGGLLEHTLSMAELAVAVAGHYPELDLGLLLTGVLFHDLGKLVELGAMPANDYTEAGRLVGHVVIGRDLLRERCAAIEGFPADLQLRLEHLVLSHQGRLEFGSPVEPMTPEALALHFIDDLDSKLNQLRGAQQRGGGMQWLRGLGRYVLLPETAVAEDGDGADGEADPQSRLDL
ncbi:MAG: HD domain-containing protein [Thermoanaerobaculia bacterium]